MRGFFIFKETLLVRMLDDSRDFISLFKEIRDDKVFIIIIDVNAFIFYFIFRKVGFFVSFLIFCRVRGRNMG